MSKRLEIHKETETEKASVEIIRKRDAKLIKKAIGAQATKSTQAKAVKESIAKQGLEFDSKQLKTVQKSLGQLASEKGLTKLPQRFRSRKLVNQIKYARKEIA